MLSLISFSQLIFLLLFFSILGLGVCRAKFINNNFLLVPIWGLAISVSLAYIISANFRISGGDAMGIAVALLMLSALLRMRSISKALAESWRDGQIKELLLFAAIPTLTVILPALVMGFKYFYGDVNFDFFYNSQDSLFLATHHVLQVDPGTGAEILPLTWSANLQGRFGISLIGAFFAKFFKIDTLGFNSLLLNTLIVLFAFAMGAWCKELLGLKKKALLLGVFFAVMAGGLLQSYSYYLLGQISAIPVFIALCIYLKRYLDQLIKTSSSSLIQNGAVFIIILLINVLYIFYAALSLYAILLIGISFILLMCKQPSKKLMLQFFIASFITMLIFVFIRLSSLPETLHAMQEWAALSHKVAAGKTVLFSPEYLTESFPALLFGIANYPSSLSVFKIFIFSAPLKSTMLFIFGLWAFVTFIITLKIYARSFYSKGASYVMIALSTLVFLFSIYFFFTLSAYGIFKIEAWFMPLLIPTFFYIFSLNNNFENKYFFLKISCAVMLLLNLATSIIYNAAFWKQDKANTFINVRGLVGKDIADITARLRALKPSSVALFLTNGIENAWVANSMRDIPIKNAIHNLQPLEEKEFKASPKPTYLDWPQADYLLMPTTKDTRLDITDLPQGGNIIYKNASYMILDARHLKTLIYFGRGAYPIEMINNNQNPAFPDKFRWVEKGIEIIIYSDQPKTVNLQVEITPGYVETKSPIRQIVINTEHKPYKFSVQTKTSLTISDLKLHAGFNYLSVESPDAISFLKRQFGIRHNIPLDPRLLNFAISYVGIQPAMQNRT